MSAETCTLLIIALVLVLVIKWLWRMLKPQIQIPPFEKLQLPEKPEVHNDYQTGYVFASAPHYEAGRLETYSVERETGKL